MDLLGDLGTNDQLTSARAENAVLRNRVEELTAQVKLLTVEKAALQAEVELYRKEASALLPGLSQLALGNNSSSMDCENDNNNNTAAAVFFKSGDGVYCQNPAVVLKELHGNANPTCVALNPHNNDTVLATGGADGSLILTQWGGADDDGKGVPSKHTCRIPMAAPVVATAFCPTQNLVAAGAMDGSLQVAYYYTDTSSTTGSQLAALCASETDREIKRHSKYIKNVAWCCLPKVSDNILLLATSSADGDIHIYRVTTTTTANNDNDDEMMTMSNENTMTTTKPVVKHWQSLHLGHPVEAMCFATTSSNTINSNASITTSQLLCHARGTAVLTVFDISKVDNNNDDLTISSPPQQINLNTNAAGAVATGGFDQHVSFCILDLQTSPCGKYVALATDASRHIVLDLQTKLQIRNLYGHDADTFSSPVLAWSCNSQYLYCNDQNSSSLIVYEIASGKIVCRQTQPHTRPVKHLYSSATSNTVVTTSFDKQTVIWFAA